METLKAALNLFAQTSHARWWLGVRPNLPESDMARAIAVKVGLPTAIEPFDFDQLVRLNRAEAEQVFAIAGSTSLAYDHGPPPSWAVSEARNALADLKESAIFFTNGGWLTGASGWNPLTEATFDCGVIGFDDTYAFIFWVEDED